MMLDFTDDSRAAFFNRITVSVIVADFKRLSSVLTSKFAGNS